MTNRLLTVAEEAIYRLVHHDFAGLSIKTAAEAMGIPGHRARRLLASVKKKAPQLFPILTPEQNTIRYLYCDAGYSVKEISEKLEIKESTVHTVLNRLTKKKGIKVHFNEPNIVAFKDSMEQHVKEKF